MYGSVIGGKSVSVFPSIAPDAPAIYINTDVGEGQRILQAAQVAGCSPFSLITIDGFDWDHDMVPWDGPAVFKSRGPFTAGADGHLRLLTEEILPRAEKELVGTPIWRGIVGYSLAGLFALYAVYQTDIFSRVGSISGSLWFPGLKEYVLTHEPKRALDCAYFSLGSKENRTRDPVLKSVRQATEEICDRYRTVGIDTVFRLEPGNHFDRVSERTATGIDWLLSR